MPRIYPDYPAPIIRNVADGELTHIEMQPIIIGGRQPGPRPRLPPHRSAVWVVGLLEPPKAVRCIVCRRRRLSTSARAAECKSNAQNGFTDAGPEAALLSGYCPPSRCNGDSEQFVARRSSARLRSRLFQSRRGEHLRPSNQEYISCNPKDEASMFTSRVIDAFVADQIVAGSGLPVGRSIWALSVMAPVRLIPCLEWRMQHLPAPPASYSARWRSVYFGQRKPAG
jgi:hypothetical protein